MGKSRIIENGNTQFLEDLKKVNDVMVYAKKSGLYLRITKREIRQEAERTHIFYHFTDKIFKNKRIVIVID